MSAPWARGARLRIVGRMHGSQTVNVIHFATNTVVNDGANLDALLLALATAMLDCVLDSLLPAITSDWTVDHVDAQGIYPVLTDPVVATPQGVNAGTSAAQNVSFAATLVNLRTGIGGRRGRGKMFLPPPGDAQVTNSIIDPVPIQTVVEFLACVAGKFGGAAPTTDWHIGVLSRKDLKEVGGTFDNSFRLVTQMTPSNVVAVMRSRKLGHGI